MTSETPCAFLGRFGLSPRQKDNVLRALASLSENPEPPGSRQIAFREEEVSPAFRRVTWESRELFISVDKVHYLYVPYVVHHKDRKIVICKIVARRGLVPTGDLDFS
jgi:hypothetical protein